jgi:hypothetical protein
VLLNFLAINKPELDTIFRSILNLNAPPIFETWLSTPKIPKQSRIDIVGLIGLNLEVWGLLSPWVAKVMSSASAQAHQLPHSCTQKTRGIPIAFLQCARTIQIKRVQLLTIVSQSDTCETNLDTWETNSVDGAITD